MEPEIKKVDFSPDMSQGTITLELATTDANVAYERLGSLRSKSLAIGEATKKGMNDPRLVGSLTVYGVDTAGQQVVDPRAGTKIAAFRCDIQVQRKLI